MSKGLPIEKILWGAFVIPWQDRRVYAEALAVPAIVIILVTAIYWSMSSSISGWQNLQLGLVYWASFTIFAVICHRLILLPPFYRTPEPPQQVFKRALKFFVFLLVIGLVWSSLEAVIKLVLALLFSGFVGEGSADEFMMWIEFLAFIPAAYVPARLSLMLPAVAIDEPIDWRQSWELSQGNGWRLVVVVGILPLAVSSVMNSLDFVGNSIIGILLWCLLSVILAVVEVAALSLAYWELGKGPGKDQGDNQRKTIINT